MTSTTASDSQVSQVRVSGWVGRGLLVVLSWAVCVFVVATVVQATGMAGSATGRVVSASAVLVARCRRGSWCVAHGCGGG